MLDHDTSHQINRFVFKISIVSYISNLTLFFFPNACSFSQPVGFLRKKQRRNHYDATKKKNVFKTWKKVAHFTSVLRWVVADNVR